MREFSQRRLSQKSAGTQEVTVLPMGTLAEKRGFYPQADVVAAICHTMVGSGIRELFKEHGATTAVLIEGEDDASLLGAALLRKDRYYGQGASSGRYEPQISVVAFGVHCDNDDGSINDAVLTAMAKQIINTTYDLIRKMYETESTYVTRRFTPTIRCAMHDVLRPTAPALGFVQDFDALLQSVQAVARGEARPNSGFGEKLSEASRAIGNLTHKHPQHEFAQGIAAWKALEIFNILGDPDRYPRAQAIAKATGRLLLALQDAVEFSCEQLHPSVSSGSFTLDVSGEDSTGSFSVHAKDTEGIPRGDVSFQVRGPSDAAPVILFDLYNGSDAIVPLAATLLKQASTGKWWVGQRNA
jgi:hypothetical protein